MASRKRRPVQYEDDDEADIGALIRPKRETPAPTICSLPIEGIGPTLDPYRALLRRVFFLNEDRTKYVSVAFYPGQEYAALVEFKKATAAPLILTQQHLTILVEHLPHLIETLCNDGNYTSGVHDNFSVVTGGTYRTAWMRIGQGKQRKDFVLKLAELQYLHYIMYLVWNQLTRYNEAKEDVKAYSASVLASSDFIEPPSNYSKHILYPQLHEELKAAVLL
jgi:hypothetical protein